MQRVKTLGGIVMPGQWDALGELVRELTPSTPLHLTTRQELEIHDLSDETVPLAQRRIAEMGLTSVGACGDTLRNVTVCPCSGTAAGCPDLAPLAWAIRETLESLECIFSLPRKFKISLSACEDGCNQPWINDIGLVARRRMDRWGFEVIAAGSLGARPGTGMQLFEWLPGEDVIPLIVGAVQMFDSAGDRENRRRARLRHVRERVGDAEFTRMLLDAYHDAKARTGLPRVALSGAVDGFDARCALTFPNGDVSADAAAALAELCADGQLALRVGRHHRVFVFGPDRRTIERRIAALPVLAESARPQTSVVACPGTRWCSRGLADTNGLADRIRHELGDRLPAGATICVSGCPNGCAHSRVADVGVSGRLVERDGQRSEAYDLYAGGGMGRTPKLAELVDRRLDAESVVRRIAQLDQPAGQPES